MGCGIAINDYHIVSPRNLAFYAKRLASYSEPQDAAALYSQQSAAASCLKDVPANDKAVGLTDEQPRALTPVKFLRLIECFCDGG